MGFLRGPGSGDDPPPEDPGGSDAWLVSQAKEGDARAFALLYRRYLNQVYDFAAHRLDSDEAAEDATHTIFMRALTSLKTCRDEERFVGWLFAIARNVINDYYRDRRHRMEPLDTAPEVEDPSESPEETAIRVDDERRLQEAKENCLNQKERELLDLRLQGLSGQDIAKALGRGHSAIRTAQHRLIEKLRYCFGIMASAGRFADG